MSYVGNRQGPRKSDIVRRLGPGYFGISPEELDREIEFYLADESTGEVDPVCADRHGRYCLVFNAPAGGTQRFYLDENGYQLSGSIRETAVENAD